MELQLFVSPSAGEPPKLYTFPDPGRIVLGRGPESPVPMDGPAISREHLAFEVRDGRVFVSDLSSNGSFLNGQRLPRNEAQRIIEEDEVRAAGYAIAFRLVTDEPPPPPKTEPSKPVSKTPSQAEAKTAAHAKTGAGTPAGAPPAPAKAPFRIRLSGLEWISLFLVLLSIALILLYVYS